MWFENIPLLLSIPILSSAFLKSERLLFRWVINYYRAGLRIDEISLTKCILKLSAEIYIAIDFFKGFIKNLKIGKQIGKFLLNPNLSYIFNKGGKNTAGVVLCLWF